MPRCLPTSSLESASRHHGAAARHWAAAHYTVAAQFVRAARAVAVAAEPDCWMRTRRGSHRRVAACSAAGKRRCGPHPGSGRCTNAKHLACKPSAVPTCRDILPRKLRSARQCRRSKTRDQAQSVQFAYPDPPRLAKSSSINEAWEGSWPTTKRESHTQELEPISPCRSSSPLGRDQDEWCAWAARLLRRLPLQPLNRDQRRGDAWPDDTRLSDIEERFTCRVCGKRGADVRPDFNWNRKQVSVMGYR